MLRTSRRQIKFITPEGERAASPGVPVAAQRVTLTGSGQDSYDVIVAYAWSPVSGPSIGFSDSPLDSHGQCVGTSLVVHNDNSVNLLIECNLIEERNPAPGCW